MDVRPLCLVALACASALAGCDVLTKQKYEDEVRQHLFDPAAAQFRNTRIVSIRSKEGSEMTDLCGEINAKDLAGGYVGYQSFYYVIRDRPSQFSAKWPTENKGQLMVFPAAKECTWRVLFDAHCGTTAVDDSELWGTVPDFDHTCPSVPNIGP